MRALSGKQLKGGRFHAPGRASRVVSHCPGTLVVEECLSSPKGLAGVVGVCVCVAEALIEDPPDFSTWKAVVD